MLLGPTALLASLELVLRMVGCGYPTAFFLKSGLAGQTNLVENHYFSRRFFPAGLVRHPRSLAFAPTTRPEDLRIFIFGESAAEGDPAPPFGFGRILQVLLRDYFPEKNVEVINTAFTAINSHVILPIARECAGESGKVWILYMGNNEVVGPYGAGTILSSQVPSLPVIRGSLALKSTRTGQLLEDWRARMGPAREWTGMELFVEQQLRWDDRRMARVYKHFETNLRDIIHLGIRSRARLLLCTMGANLRDCAPFGSLHPTALSNAQRSQWEKDYQAGAAMESERNFPAAIALYEQAARSDDQFAELYFRLGRCLEAAGKPAEARLHFERARDLDTLRFRADSRINQIIRRATDGLQSGQLELVDAESLLARSSTKGITGKELFCDHVHLTFKANYLLARQLAAQLVEWFSHDHGAERSPRQFLSLENCRERLALRDADSLKTAETMRKRISRPPFIQQLDHAEHEALWDARASELRPRAADESLQAASALFTKALSHAPEDWQLHEQFAVCLLEHGASARAIEQWRHVVKLLPHRAQTYFILGSILSAEGKTVEAMDLYEQAIHLQPDYLDAILGLGRALMQQNRFPEAIAVLRRAAALRPQSARALNQLGLALLKAGRTREALQKFGAAARTDPELLAARLNVSSALLAEGKLDDALSNYERTAKAFPNSAAPRVAFGRVLEGQGRLREATEKYMQAVQAEADDYEARMALASALARQNRAAEAAEQFAAAERFKAKVTSRIQVDW